MLENRPDPDELARVIAQSISHYMSRVQAEYASSLHAPPGYTTSGLARELRLTDRAIRAAIERGDLTAVKHGGRWLIARDAVDAFLSPGDRSQPRRHRKSSSGRGTLGRFLEQEQAPTRNRQPSDTRKKPDDAG